MEPPVETRADQRFPKHSRLVRAEDFVDTKSRGSRRAGPLVVIWLHKNALGRPRLGLAVSRKVGKSHERNLLKRRTRELFRRQAVPFTGSFDYVVVFRPGAAALDFSGLRAELARLLARGGKPP